jgi:3-deoxy-D-manno-octulosonic-acid transferase
MLGMILSRFVFLFSSICYFGGKKVLRNRVFIALINVEWKENRKVKKFNDLGNDRIRTKRNMKNEYENKERLIAYLQKMTLHVFCRMQLM